MITADGWFDWAERWPGHPDKVNGGRNSIDGIFCHSAEGYVTYLKENIQQPWQVGGQKSWHLSNLLDGHLLQHYPIYAQTWHATKANNRYLGMEHEGHRSKETSLSSPQIDTTVRVIRELAELRGWTPRRPSSPADITHTLWEHNEVVRLGGSGSSCPNGRIPWPTILDQLEETTMAAPDIRVEGNFTVLYNGGVPVWRWGSTDGLFPGRVSKNFGGTWVWLRAGPNGAVWDQNEGD